MSLNQILLIGNAGRDAELRYTANGRAVANFSIAVNRRWMSNNEWQEETEWFNVSVWGQQAENIANRVRRGARVFVDGRLSTREWTNQSGVTRTSLDVNAFRVIEPDRPRRRRRRWIRIVPACRTRNATSARWWLLATASTNRTRWRRLRSTARRRRFGRSALVNEQRPIPSAFNRRR